MGRAPRSCRGSKRPVRETWSKDMFTMFFGNEVKLSRIQRMSHQVALLYGEFSSRFGFAPASEIDPVPYRLRDIGGNFVSLMLIVAHNPAAAHASMLIGLRVPLFMSRRSLEDRYG
jgi:hypothetical protein